MIHGKKIINISEIGLNMVSSCLADGSWSPVNLECIFDPDTVVDSQSFNISQMNLSSLIIIVVLSGIILLLLALIVICFHCHKTHYASTSKQAKSKSPDADTSVSTTIRNA